MSMPGIGSLLEKYLKLEARCAEFEVQLAEAIGVIHAQALLDNEAHDIIAKFSGAMVNPDDQTIESVNGHYIYIKQERLAGMKAICKHYGQMLAKILSVWKRQAAELEAENTKLKEENSHLSSGDLGLENTHLRAKASMLEAQRDAANAREADLRSENKKLRIDEKASAEHIEGLEIALSNVTNRVAKLRAALPPVERLQTIADFIDNEAGDSAERRLWREEFTDPLRSWASAIEALDAPTTEEVKP